MNKEILLQLYERNDRKRRRALFDIFYTQIQLNLSLSFIAEMINRELEVENLIKTEDIKYCRHYFQNKVIPNKKTIELPKKQSISENLSDQRTTEINWTNPDEINLKPIIKSKFLKS